MKKKINVLITAIGGGGHGEQILKALRLVGDNRYCIFGADANPHCPQFNLVEGHAALPLASAPNYLDRLFEVCENFKIDALFHGCEPELKLFSQHRETIEAKGIFLPINPINVIETCMDKARTFEFLKAQGIDVPFFTRVSSTIELDSVKEFPVVVKPSLGGGGSADVFIAQSRKELLALGAYLDLDGATRDFLIQEYVGSPEDEFTVGVLHDMNGLYINSIALRRMLTGQLNIRSSVPNRTGLRKFGPNLLISSGVSHGQIGRFPEVTSQCCEVARLIGARGPLNIQCRLVDGKIKIFEINPRFSGTTSLRAMVGYNEPDILMRKHFENEKIEKDFQYKEATILRSLTEEIL